MLEHNILLKLARDFVQQKRQEGAALEAAFLVGSVARHEEPLGNTVDLDIWLVQYSAPVPSASDPSLVDSSAEDFWISNDVLVDCRHFNPTLFDNKRALRTDAYFGPALFNAISLYDPRHLLDLIQASSRSRYHMPENVYGRARTAFSLAQQQFRPLGQYLRQPPPSPLPLSLLCKLHELVWHSTSALLLLAGRESSGRRQMALFSAAAQELNAPQLPEMLFEIMHCSLISGEQFPALLQAWQTLESELRGLGNLSWEQEFAADARRNYYLSGWQALLDGGQAPAAFLQLESNFLNLLQKAQNIAPISAQDALQRQLRDWLELTDKLHSFDFGKKLWKTKEYLEAIDRLLLEWARNENLEI